MSDSPLDRYRHQVETWKSQGESNATIAKWITEAHGVPTSEKSIRRALKRWRGHGYQGLNVTVLDGGEKATIETEVLKQVTDPEELMRELGVNPQEWDVDSVVVNRWGDAGDPSYQLKANLKRKRNLDRLILPAAFDDKPKITRNIIKPRDDESYLVVILSDNHAPFHDENLHYLVNLWLDENRPAKGVHAGDLLDFPESSRHRHKPAFKASAQKCLNAGGQILYDNVSASPSTDWEFVPGNHDFRLRNGIIDYNADLIGLTAAVRDGEVPPNPALSLHNLLHFDALGIKGVLMDEEDQYEHGQVEISPKLAARHGWVARKQGGASALSTLEHLGHSVVVGHTHRQAIVHKTMFDIHGEASVHVAAEAGCLCIVDRKGLGYAPNPDWQPGFVTAQIYPDGTFSLEKATYVNGALYWRDQRYV